MLSYLNKKWIFKSCCLVNQQFSHNCQNPSIFGTFDEEDDVLGMMPFTQKNVLRFRQSHTVQLKNVGKMGFTTLLNNGHFARLRQLSLRESCANQFFTNLRFVGGMLPNFTDLRFYANANILPWKFSKCSACYSKVTII